MSKVIEVDENNFDQEVLASDIPVVIDFYATWCGPCRMLGPLLEKVAAKYEGRVKFVRINVDENMDLAISYSVVAVPDLQGFRDGDLVGRKIGFIPEKELEKFLEPLLS